MSNILVSVLKELRSIFRDKKFLSIILFMPLIIPAFIVGFGFLYDSLDSNDGTTIGVNYKMSEVETEILKSVDKNIKTEYRNKDELANMLDKGEIDGYITFEDGKYYLFIDTSSTKGMTLSSILRAYFEQYNNYLAQNFLIQKGINPDEVFNIVQVELQEQVKDGISFFTNFIVSFALIYLVMIIVITAMNTSTDLIAGEKERGTFETLLTFPLTSNEIIGGKLLAIVVSCITSSFIGIATSMPAFMYIKNNTETFKDLSLNITANTVLLSIVSVVLISCVVGVLSIFLCGRAKTFKEAQSKVSFLSFVSMIPMFTNLANTSSDVLYFIPVANGGQILNDLFLKDFSTNNFLIFVISSIVVTLALLVYVSKQYRDEKALF